MRLPLSLSAAAILTMPLQAQCPEALENPGGTPWGGFGGSVDLRGDLLVIGAPNFAWPYVPGVAYAFRELGSGWSLEAELASSQPTPDDDFGSGVAVWGDRILVGAKKDSTAGPRAGRAFLFERQAATWTEVAVFDAPATLSQGEFGTMVALEGDVAVVSAPRNDRVFAYRRDAGGAWSLAQEFAAGGYFGADVALDGGRIAITDTPRVNVYEPAGGAWVLADVITPPAGETLWRVDLEGDLLVAASSGGGCPDGGGCPYGLLFVYRDMGGSWVEEAVLESTNAHHESLLGRGLSISNGRFLASTRGKEDYKGIYTPGAAYLFEKTASGWEQRLRLRSTDESYLVTIRNQVRCRTPRHDDRRTSLGYGGVCGNKPGSVLPGTFIKRRAVAAAPPAGAG